MTSTEQIAQTVVVRLGPVEQIPVGEGRSFAVGDLTIAVFRLRSGALRAISATCPHAGDHWPTVRSTTSW